MPIVLDHIFNSVQFEVVSITCLMFYVLDYPCPLVSFRNRKPVFEEVGHTVMNLLCDFRNFQYHLPFIENADCCMEKGVITLRIARYRYDQVTCFDLLVRNHTGLICYAFAVTNIMICFICVAHRLLKFASPPTSMFFQSDSVFRCGLMPI